MKRLILFVVLFGVCRVSYSQWASLSAPTPVPNAEFGGSVASSENYLGISAPGESKVYIYTDVASSLQLVKTLNVLARNLALTDDWLFLSDRYFNGNTSVVKVFRRTGNDWTQSQILEAPSSVTADRFGISVIASQSELVVGTTDRGAFIYRLDENTGLWSLVQIITHPQNVPATGFGVLEMAQVGDQLIIPASSYDSAGLVNNGKVYFYRKGSGSNYELFQEIEGTVSSESIGMAVSLEDESTLWLCSRTVAIGSPCGTIQKYKYLEESWIHQSSFSNLDAGNSLLRYYMLFVKDGWALSQVGAYVYATRSWGSDTYLALQGFQPDVDITNQKNLNTKFKHFLLFGIPRKDFGYGKVVYVNLSEYVDRPIQVNPPNQQENVQLNPLLTWSQDPNAIATMLQVSTDAAFNNVILEQVMYAGETEVRLELESASFYYWKLRSEKGDWTSPWTPTRSFNTEYQVAPILGADSAIVLEDTSSEIAVLDNDSDPDNDVLTIINVGAAGNGQVSIVGSKVKYTPSPNFFGGDSFTYTVRDEYVHEVTSSVSVEVLPVPDTPVALDDLCEALEDVLSDCAVTVNDSDADGDPLAVRIITAPVHGAGSTLGQTVKYLGVANFSGPDSLRYELSDGTGRADTAWVRLNVRPANDLPIVLGESVQGLEDSELSVNVLSNDSDVDGDALSVLSVSGPNGWTTIISGSNITLIPPANYFGQANIEYQVTDSVGEPVSGTVQVVVLPVNDPPTVPSSIYPTANEVVEIAGLPTDSLAFQWEEGLDADGDEIRYSYAVGLDASLTPALFSFAGIGIRWAMSIGDLAKAVDGSGGTMTGGDLVVFYRLSVADDSVLVVGEVGSFTFRRGAVTWNEEPSDLPAEFSLLPAFPNPFNPTTTVSYTLPTSSDVSLVVTDLLGRQVATIVHMAAQAAGKHTVTFNAIGLSSGTYLVRLEAGSFVQTRQVVLLK